METDCYKLLKIYKNRLTKQQYKTLKGQIQHQDYDGFRKGLFTLAMRKVVKYNA